MQSRGESTTSVAALRVGGVGDPRPWPIHLGAPNILSTSM
jgi:hypothetical protein